MMAQKTHFPLTTLAEASDDFRRVLWTGRYVQLVVMTIPAGGEIGSEVHPETDQVLAVVSGVGEATLGARTRTIEAGDVVAVAAGTEHNVVNTGPLPLVLSTVYGPPEHAVGAVHHTREEAEEAEESGEDVPPQRA
jgi:mannose-6-phosphate isomerase-like protein (cupin superfamily)